MGDLLTEHERSKNRDWQADKDTNGITRQANASTGSLNKLNVSTRETISGHDEVREEHNDNKEKES